MREKMISPGKSSLREIYILTFSQIAKETRDRISAKYSSEIKIKPWMEYRGIKIIEEILNNLRPKNCLEWGAGYSTLYFQRFLHNDSKCLSVEHDK